LSPKTKLPKTFSESDIKTAQNASNEIKTLTKPIATLAAAGGLEYTIQDQQKTLVLTEITNLTPIGLLSKQQSYYLLGSPSQVQEIHEKQPKVIFSIPPDPSHLPKHHETDDVLITFLMKNSSMASLLKSETYHEMNDLHLKKANSDWLTNQEARYAVSQMFAGCILLDGTKAILINCVEPYGRKKRIDPHYERYSKDDCNSSIPDSNCYHKQVCVKLFESDNSNKLVIGLFSCNLLVTSSCTLSNNPVICVGPSTNSFTPSNYTKIFLHEKSIEAAEKLFNDKGCSQLYPHDTLNQCKQVRSKFYRIETYSTCRSSSTFTLGHLHQPYTVWTLYDYDSAQTMDSQAKRGSLIFQKIASNVHDSIKNNVDSFIEKKALENYQDDGGELAATVKEILKLFGQNERISIIGNKDLDKHLQSIAKTMNSSLTAANQVVKERLSKIFS
jgi:hypothetical protein